MSATKIIEPLAKTSVSCVRMSRDWAYIATVCQDAIQIWQNDILVKTLEKTRYFNCLDWSHDSQKLTAGATHGDVIIWQIQNIIDQPELDQTPHEKKFKRIHSDCVLSISYAEDGRLATNCRRGIIHIWSVEENIIQTIDMTIPILIDIHFNGNKLNGTTSQFVEAELNLANEDITQHNSLMPAQKIAIDCDQKAYLCRDSNDDIKVWNTKTREIFQIQRDTIKDFIFSIQIQHSKKKMLLGTTNGVVYVEFMDEKEKLEEIVTHGLCYDEGVWCEFLLKNKLYDPRILLFVDQFLPPKKQVSILNI